MLGRSWYAALRLRAPAWVDSEVCSRSAIRISSPALMVRAWRLRRRRALRRQPHAALHADSPLPLRAPLLAPTFAHTRPYMPGVGTKLKLAFDMDKHDTIGQDLVAMSVNDIVTLGAAPMFFLDYFATSKLDVDQAEAVIVGIVRACEESGCALLGGETAEMPGFYSDGEYDLSGFAVGSVKKDKVVDGKRVLAGDVLVGLPSTGVHSNGFSLVRRILERSGMSLADPLPTDPSRSIGDALLAPTALYVKPVLSALDAFDVRALCHVTGGGFTENLPRVMPDGLGCSVTRGSWASLPVFEWIQQAGSVEEEEMLRTFNCGVGMVMVMPAADAQRCIEGPDAMPGATIIGSVVEGEGVVYV